MIQDVNFRVITQTESPNRQGRLAYLLATWKCGSSYKWLYNWLVVWNMAFMTFHSVGNFITPTDELIFSEGQVYHQPDNYGDDGVSQLWGIQTAPAPAFSDACIPQVESLKKSSKRSRFETYRFEDQRPAGMVVRVSISLCPAIQGETHGNTLNSSIIFFLKKTLFLPVSKNVMLDGRPKETSKNVVLSEVMVGTPMTSESSKKACQLLVFFSPIIWKTHEHQYLSPCFTHIQSYSSIFIHLNPQKQTYLSI